MFHPKGLNLQCIVQIRYGFRRKFSSSSMETLYSNRNRKISCVLNLICEKRCLSTIKEIPAIKNHHELNNNNNNNQKASKLVTEIMDGLSTGSRASLATAITLVETENPQKKKLANHLLNLIMVKSEKPTSYRIGISGPPGAGKSTFIEVFGKFLTSMGHKVAVLAVDPSSSSTGGSLLGDKTRMPELTRDPNAYIRPSPARGCLGGVTRSTNEAIVLCEYTGYDMIIVETVGVGQSEYAVSNMVDVFILLLPPGGGDELQGVKRGIVEKADLLLVTKADGDLAPAAHRTQYEYTAALKFMRPTNRKWKTKVLQISSRTKEGIDKFWEELNKFRNITQEDFLKKRGDQRAVWMWTHVQEGLENMLLKDSRLKEITDNLLQNVRDNKITPGQASDQILSLFKITNNNSSENVPK